MSKEKLETGVMLNPRCQKCRKKDKCNNKTLCAYLIPKEVKTENIKISIGVDISYDKDKQISQHQSYL